MHIARPKPDKGTAPASPPQFTASAASAAAALARFTIAMDFTDFAGCAPAESRHRYLKSSHWNRVCFTLKRLSNVAPTRSKLMKPRLVLFSLVLASFTGGSALAGPREATIEDAIDLLDELCDAPEKRIPPALLRDAAAVVIAPDVLKGGFIVAGRHGHGIMLIRQKNGWSDPIFVRLTGGSVGWQVGVQATDLFLVVRNKKSLDRILRGAGKLTLGGDASVSAGPVGRDVSVATDAQLRSAILAYSRSRGIFAGVSVEGDTLQVDHLANDRFYGKRRTTVADIVDGKFDAPKSAAILVSRLTEWSGESRTPPRPAPPPAIDSKK
jgi:lipid-binding SYLF domain-containing protein